MFVEVLRTISSNKKRIRGDTIISLQIENKLYARRIAASSHRRVRFPLFLVLQYNGEKTFFFTLLRVDRYIFFKLLSEDQDIAEMEGNS